MCDFSTVAVRFGAVLYYTLLHALVRVNLVVLYALVSVARPCLRCTLLFALYTLVCTAMYKCILSGKLTSCIDNAYRLKSFSLKPRKIDCIQRLSDLSALTNACSTVLVLVYYICNIYTYLVFSLVSCIAFYPNMQHL